jgi:putative DNA primase/helicase
MSDGFTISDDDDKPRRTRARDLIPVIVEKADLWCDRRGAAFATIERDGHRESHPVASRGFRAWFTSEFFAETGGAVSGSALADGVRLAEAHAMGQGAVHTAWRRWGMHAKRVYLDLGGASFRAVEIDPLGWRVMANPPCRFVRTPDCLALPEPEADAARWPDLCRFINAANDDAAVLLWAWMVCAARPFEDGGAYPALVFHGPQGSGKSDATRRVCEIIDPTKTGVRSLPREERDLAAALFGRHLLALDNVSGISAPWSDILCRVVTGGAFAGRSLHTDLDETAFDACRPLVINGIPAAAGRADLAERAISLELAPIGGARRTDAALRQEFAAALPGLLGLLLDALSSALRNLPTTRVPDLPRMADACTWAEAAAEGLGIEPGRIAAAWRANRASADADLVESDEVACAVRDMLAAREVFKDSATELAKALAGHVSERTLKSPFWPKTPAALGSHLRRIGPALRTAWGIVVESGKGGAQSSRWWSLRRL